MLRDTTFGLHPAQMARVLAIGADVQAASGPQRMGDPGQTLRHLLDGQLCLNGPLADALGRILDERNCTTEELLLDPETDAGTIETIKEYGKGLTLCSGDGAVCAAGTALYYAALASALVFHDRKISKHTYRRISAGLAALSRRTWIPTELTDLYDRAREACRGKDTASP